MKGQKKVVRGLEREQAMITLTLGTIDYPFNRAIDWIEILIEKGIIAEPMLVQHGITDVSALKKYSQVTTSPILNPNKMAEIIERSRLVISHAGQGSTRSLAAKKTSFILIPRLARYGEHIDDHQLLFAKSVEPMGVKYCLTLESLEKAILNPPPPMTVPLFNEPKLADHLLEHFSEKKINLSNKKPERKNNFTLSFLK